MNCWRVRTGLPPCAEEDGVILALPDLRQPTDTACGRCCLEIVWDYLGVKSRHVPDNPIDGMTPDVLENAMWLSGLRVKAGSWDVEDLRYLTRRGQPVICAVTTDAGVGHWVVVAGVARGKVAYQCPTAGAVRESVAAWEERWTDWTRRGSQYWRWGIACAGPA